VLLVSVMVPMISPIFTSSPSRWAMRSSTPALGAGTSTSILSVSSSTRGSPAATASPSFLSHRAIRASTTDSPTSGTTMLIDMFKNLQSGIGNLQSGLQSGNLPICNLAGNRGIYRKSGKSGNRHVGLPDRLQIRDFR
jgi:hypothetical protein